MVPILLLLYYRPFIWDKSVEVASKYGYGQNEYVISLVFLGINTLYEQIVHLPFSLYFTFVLEQKVRTNNNTWLIGSVLSIQLSWRGGYWPTHCLFPPPPRNVLCAAWFQQEHPGVIYWRQGQGEYPMEGVVMV